MLSGESWAMLLCTVLFVKCAYHKKQLREWLKEQCLTQFQLPNHAHFACTADN